MELRSTEGKSYVSLTEWKADEYGVKTAIEVRDGDFTGAYDEVWFFRDAFAAFVRALVQFNRTTDGEVRLESMSPGEAVLSFSSLNSGRVVLVEAQVSRAHYLGDRYFYDRVAVTFLLDQFLLPDIVRNLAAVIGEADLT